MKTQVKIELRLLSTVHHCNKHRCKIPQVQLLFSHLSIAIYKVVSKANSQRLRKITTQIKHLPSKRTSSSHYKGKFPLPSIPTPLSLTTLSPFSYHPIPFLLSPNLLMLLTPHSSLPTQPLCLIHSISTISRAEGKFVASVVQEESYWDMWQCVIVDAFTKMTIW